MKIEPVEIYSDASNFAVMRHPGRRFPGALVQGDSLQLLCSAAEAAEKALKAGDAARAGDYLSELSGALRARLDHYGQVLTDHGLELPYSERPAPRPED